MEGHERRSFADDYKRQATDLIASSGRSAGSTAKESGLRDSALRRSAGRVAEQDDFVNGSLIKRSTGKLRVVATLLATLVGVGPQPAFSACLDLKTETLSFTGTLTFQIFGGPPYNGGIAKGDTPEPGYILKLDSPICVGGDDFLEPNEKIDRVQVYPDSDQTRPGLLSAKLRSLVGTHVSVDGKSAFGAHTGHHHAPLMLPITAVSSDSDLTDGYDTALATVQGFYLALAAGNGEEAVRFLAPEKRSSGPLSAEAITRFYGRLQEALSLTNAEPIGRNKYRVRYTYIALSSKRCEGEAVVDTVRVRDESMISSIRALNGC